MKLRLVRPVVATKRHEPLLARQPGVKQRLERMVEYARHFARRGAQLLEHRDVIQVRDHGRHDHPVLRKKRLERAERVDVRRAQRQRDFLVCFPVLYIHNPHPHRHAQNETK